MGFGKDGKGIMIREDQTITLGALADQAATLINAIQLDEDFRILKTQIVATVKGLAAGEGAGLILLLTEGLLTVAQVEAVMELNGPLAPRDTAAMEIASRWVRTCGVTDHEVSEETNFNNENDGPMLEVMPRWTFQRRRTATEGGWNWVVYNNGKLLTTGASVQVKAIHYGVWVQ